MTGLPRKKKKKKNKKTKHNNIEQQLERLRAFPTLM